MEFAKELLTGIVQPSTGDRRSGRILPCPFAYKFSYPIITVVMKIILTLHLPLRAAADAVATAPSADAVAAAPSADAVAAAPTIDDVANGVDTVTPAIGVDVANGAAADVGGVGVGNSITDGVGVGNSNTDGVAGGSEIKKK